MLNFWFRRFHMIWLCWLRCKDVSPYKNHHSIWLHTPKITHRYLRHELLLVSTGSYLPIFRMIPLFNQPTNQPTNQPESSHRIYRLKYTQRLLRDEAIFNLVLKILTISCASAAGQNTLRGMVLRDMEVSMWVPQMIHFFIFFSILNQPAIGDPP